MRNIFLGAVALALGACAQMPEPTRQATRVERIIVRDYFNDGSQCYARLGAEQPTWSSDKIMDTCGCVRDKMVENLDDRLVVWIAEDPQANMKSTNPPPWVMRIFVPAFTEATDAARKTCGVTP